MSYHYQMNSTNNDFFDSTNYIPQMQMHHGYQEFYPYETKPTVMATSTTSQQQPQPTENGIIQGSTSTDHGGYNGWRQHDWNSTSSWTMGTQMDHMSTTTGNGSHLGINHTSTHGNIGSTPQIMTANHVVADTFRIRNSTQLPSTNLCYMDPPPARLLPKKPSATVHRPLARSTPKPFRCQTCGKAFSQAANLTAHKRIHTGEKPFMCPVCNRPFSQSSSLVTHRRTHTGERPYPCAQCEKAFTDSSTLTKHLRTHTGHKPYVCSICMMKFTQSGNLHRHMKTHK